MINLGEFDIKSLGSRIWKKLSAEKKRRPVRKFTSGDICFLYRHPILEQFARDLENGLFDATAFPVKIRVFCGIHFDFKTHWQSDDLKIAIQTEQLLDSDGNALFGQEKPGIDRNILKAISHADVVLDLSVYNKPYYEKKFGIEAADRVVFGPHVFPWKKVEFSNEGEGFLFFGHVNDRRREKLDVTQPGNVRILPKNHFGRKLEREIRKSKAVVNIHVADGVYTECPRLLTTYLQGKPVISERLDHLWVAGEDYVPFESMDADLENVFDSFSRKAIECYSFRGFLDRAIAACPERPC